MSHYKVAKRRYQVFNDEDFAMHAFFILRNMLLRNIRLKMPKNLRNM